MSSVAPAQQSRTRGLTPFPKGVSGNPKGREPGLKALILASTRNGTELVRFVLLIFRGKRPPGGRAAAPPSLRDRLDAATWLADRAFGKPVQALEHSGQIDHALSLRQEAEAYRKLSPAKRPELEAIMDEAGL
jgi:hypothetical protein